MYHLQIKKCLTAEKHAIRKIIFHEIRLVAMAPPKNSRR